MSSNAGIDRMRTFYIIWFGQLVSTLGSGLTGFALGVWIYEQTSSVTLFAINSFAFMAATMIVSPFAGALVDRWNRRWTMILSDAGAGLSTLVIWLLLLSGRLEIWMVYPLTVLSALFTAFQFPAHSAATTMLVPRDQLGRAGGMVQIGEAVSSLISPAAAGALYVAFGLQTVVMIDFATFGIAVLTLLLISIPEPKRTAAEKEEKPSIMEDIKIGWRFIVDRKGLLYWMLYIASLNFSFGLVGPLMMPMILEMGDAQKAGYVSSVFGVGMLVGTLIMSAWGGPKRRIYAVLGGGFWMGLTISVMGLKPSLVLVAAAGFLTMLGLPVLNGSSRAMWQTKVPPDLQGRVFSVRRVIGQFTSPIAALLAGPLVDYVFQPMMDEGGLLASSLGVLIGVGPGRGIALSFLVMGGAMSLFSVWGYLTPHLRLAEIEIPDAEIITADDEQAPAQPEPLPEQAD